MLPSTSAPRFAHARMSLPSSWPFDGRCSIHMFNVLESEVSQSSLDWPSNRAASGGAPPPREPHSYSKVAWKLMIFFTTSSIVRSSISSSRCIGSVLSFPASRHLDFDSLCKNLLGGFRPVLFTPLRKHSKCPVAVACYRTALPGFNKCPFFSPNMWVE